MFKNKSILITGGTGSFGQRCVKTLLKQHNPKKIIIYSRDELKQFEMSNLFTLNELKKLRFFIGDVRDSERLHLAMNDVDYVIHAAAMKQVVASEYNPIECIKTNIYGAQNVAMAALNCGVKKVIALSTDKACSPINLYGATKLASDKIFIAANNMVGDKDSRYAVVRYGNVVGSRGSVIPFFEKLIKDGADYLPVTDERMTRFWITLEEGVEFVLKSFEMMHGGEIFIPKIPSTTILDLVSAFNSGIKTKIVGIRPGEKIHEVMISSDDNPFVVEFKDHYIIKPVINFSNLNEDYTKNKLGEIGSMLKDSNFSYASNSNQVFLNNSEIKKLILEYKRLNS